MKKIINISDRNLPFRNDILKPGETKIYKNEELYDDLNKKISSYEKIGMLKVFIAEDFKPDIPGEINEVKAIPPEKRKIEEPIQSCTDQPEIDFTAPALVEAYENKIEEETQIEEVVEEKPKAKPGPKPKAKEEVVEEKPEE